MACAQFKSCSNHKFRYVPSAQYLYVQKLIPFFDQIDVKGVRLNPNPRLLQELQIENSEPLRIDARLWAVLVQIFRLPQEFQMLNITLDNPHISLLQSIPSTFHFTLITILDLQSSIDDESMRNMNLPTLSAFDGSGSRLTSHAFARLAMYKLTPGLRMLRLKNCLQIDDEIFKHLDGFPLLSVVDLRGTNCFSRFVPHAFRNDAQEPRFYEPGELAKAMKLFQVAFPRAFSSPDVFTLRIAPEKRRTILVAPSPQEDDDSQSLHWNQTDSENCQCYGCDGTTSYEGNINDLYDSEEDEIEWQSRREPSSPAAYSMDEVAAAEQEEAQRSNAARSFYSGPTSISLTPNPVDLPSSSPQFTKSRLHEESPEVLKRQARLMLFRPPPPWNAPAPLHPLLRHTSPEPDDVQEVEARLKLRVSNVTEKAKVNLSSRKAAFLKDQLTNFTKRRIPEAPATPTAVKQAKSGMPNINPFADKSRVSLSKARQSLPSSATGFSANKPLKVMTSTAPVALPSSASGFASSSVIKQSRPSTSAIPSSSTTTTSAKSNSTMSAVSRQAPEKLKPISSIPVPLLPQAELEELKERTRKRARVESLPSNLKAKTKKDSLAKDGGSVNKGKGKSTGGGENKKPFDWSSWGKAP
ncbi:hypothetical protein C8J56DRAFT_170369 [Mycena floridula]|nr:hypothetical protein C8J56DRAFT_170369 [Mycena floridula]